MAVHTKVSKEEIAKHLENYQLGKLINFHEIIDGIDNSNFILETDSNKFIFTIFESRINKSELPFFIKLKLHLANNGVVCPQPILAKSGEILNQIKGKESAIVSFLNGKTLRCLDNGFYDNITTKHCFSVGKILAEMHDAASNFELTRSNDLGVLGWNKLFAKFSHLVEGYQKNLGAEIIDLIKFLEKTWKHNLPKCAAHLDLFPDNVFFDENNNLSGVIDFYFAATDLKIYDFAIAVNAWCFDENNHFCSEKFQQMLLGYQSVNSFSQEELEFLNIALIGAALRFTLTRMHDLFFTPKESLVKIKDPAEYLSKLRFFKEKIIA